MTVSHPLRDAVAVICTMGGSVILRKGGNDYSISRVKDVRGDGTNYFLHGQFPVSRFATLDEALDVFLAAVEEPVP